MTCPVCHEDIDSVSHGACWKATYLRLLAVIARQQAEIVELKEQLNDAGILRRGTH